VTKRKVMPPEDALTFAIDKLTNEIDREFDGADVGRKEERDYYRCVDALKKLLSDVAWSVWPEQLAAQQGLDGKSAQP